MKKYSTSPTDENAIEMFRSDSIGRNEEIIRFINLLDAIDDGCAIALNGKWGSGKTFFIKQIKLIMDYSNPHSDMEGETRNALETALSTLAYKCSESYATVYYDAWANDNAEDPILSLIYTAIKSNQANIKPENKKNLSEVVAAIADVVTGKNISTLLEKVKGEDLFESIKREGDIQQLVKDFVQALIDERADQLVIFIDELDRCKPEYAIQLLERIKHYFDDERIIFVFSVNLGQLQHTVKGYYGAGFDATRYLDKFFDLRVSLPEINYDTYLGSRFNFIMTDWIYDATCIEVIKYFRFSLRETERFIRLARIACQRYRYPGDLFDERAFLFALMYFVPIIIGLSMENIDAYNRFVAGIHPGPLCEILLKPERTRIVDYLLTGNECFSETEKKDDSYMVVSIEERLRAAYAALFPKTHDPRHPHRSVGQMTFSQETYKVINQITSLLSSACDYGFE